MPVDLTELLEFSIETGQDSPLDAQGDYPVFTPVNSELLLHAEVLQILFAGEQPLMVPLRPTDKGKLRFFVGDASREGFGGANQFPDTTVATHEGLWDPDFAEGGSNLRELRIRSITCSERYEWENMMGARSGRQPTTRFGLPSGTKDHPWPTISLTFFLLLSRRPESMKFSCTVFTFRATG
jgi:hypothetical protein